MMMRSSSIVHDWVASQQYDIGYAELPKERDSINVEPIRLEGVCAVHQDHPLATLEVITPQDLDNVPLATLFAQHPTNELVHFLFEERGARYNARFELQNYISGLSLSSSSCAAVSAIRSARPAINCINQGRARWYSARLFRPSCLNMPLLPRPISRCPGWPRHLPSVFAKGSAGLSGCEAWSIAPGMT